MVDGSEVVHSFPSQFWVAYDDTYRAFAPPSMLTLPSPLLISYIVLTVLLQSNYDRTKIHNATVFELLTNCGIMI